MIRYLLLPLLCIALLPAAGCIGSNQKRNPNFQRKDKVVAEQKDEKSLISATRKNTYYLPSKTERVILDTPKNSWAKHDRDLYSTLGKDIAPTYAPVYPWFEVKELKEKKSGR
jgi:hypothetical protein